MELDQIIMGILGVSCGVLGWFARELYAATQSLRRDLSVLEVQLNRDYVRYDRLQDALKPLAEAIKELKETIAQRAP